MREDQGVMTFDIDIMKTRCGMDLKTGDIVKMKKKHPCGCDEWEILRTGADFRLKCNGCGRQIMLSRRDAEKNVRAVVRHEQ